MIEVFFICLCVRDESQKESHDGRKTFLSHDRERGRERFFKSF